MISVDNTKKLFQDALSLTPNESQVILTGGKKQLARLGNNKVHQNMLEKEYTVKVQVADGKRVGNASCNRFGGEELKLTVEQAQKVASHQKEDPDWPGFFGSTDSIVDEDFYCQDTMESCFEAKIEELEKVFVDCQKRDVEAAGAFSHGDDVTALGNSHGLFHYHTCTDASFTFSIMTPSGGTGWSEFHSHKLADIDVPRLYEIALEKALASEKPTTVDSGEYTVILEPPAVSSLMWFLGYLGFGGMAYREGRSFFSEKIGEKLLGENITIQDNSRDAQSFGCPFDLEGTKRQAVQLIEKGVFQGPVLDVVNARKLENQESTGHALPYPSTVGPLPLNLSIASGDSSLEEMIKTTKKGILVTRFFYDNVIDPGKLTLTGMTRDGTFLIEDGKISRGLKNMRYNEAIPRILNHVVSLSQENWSLRGFGRMSMPAMKVEGFRFTGASL